MSVAHYLEGCVAVLAVLVGVTNVAAWLVTRHRLKRGGHVVGEAVGTTVKKGAMYAPPYTPWQSRHALVRYADRDGGVHMMTARSDLRPGTRVPLVYDTRRPGQAQEQSAGSDLRFGLIGIGLAAALVVVILLT